MKFKITLKDPDGVWESLEQAADRSLADVENLSDDEKEALTEDRRENLSEIARKWIKYDEYLTVEIDTESNTCTVVPA